jgi:hypothetical protein
MPPVVDSLSPGESTTLFALFARSLLVSRPQKVRTGRKFDLEAAILQPKLRTGRKFESRQPAGAAALSSVLHTGRKFESRQPAGAAALSSELRTGRKFESRQPAGVPKTPHWREC